MAYPPELKQRAREMRKQGVLCRVIAVDLGVTKATVIRWTNPALEKRGRVRARKLKYTQKRKCANCGRRANNKATLCRTCFRLTRKYWTRDRVIEAIQDWTIKNGWVPTYAEWQRSGLGHPAISSIKGGPNPSFLTWGEALTAAGFKPRHRRVRKGVGGPLTEAQKKERAALRRHAREEKLRMALEKENGNDEPGSV